MSVVSADTIAAEAALIRQWADHHGRDPLHVAVEIIQRMRPATSFAMLDIGGAGGDDLPMPRARLK